MASEPVRLRDLAAFVKALQENAGYERAADWARDANFPASNLSDVRNAKAGIEGVNLLRLIRAAADRIEEDALALALRAAQPEPSLAEAVVRLEAAVARLTAHLEDPPNAQGHGRPP